MSLFRYIVSEVTRSYGLEEDQEMYTTRREKMYTFMRIPRELEKFMSYGFFHCLDSFLFIFTFLPLRMFLAVVTLFLRIPLTYLGIAATSGRLLRSAEIIDLLKCFIIGSCCYAMSYVDTSMLYHMIKSQSVIKLYLMYNMIEVADRLFSAFGQDTIDALFWTATEPRGKKREHIGVIPHVLLAVAYVFLHSMLVLLQATTLNVAINASNKALLTIMMSNNFVELKGSVFKKFDRSNLFQVSCSDVRERFHLFALLFVVVVQTMKEYGWREDSFWTLAPDCLLVLGAEILVDWLKHAFITRFNEVPADVYKDYTISLAYDLAQTKQNYAFSDHSDIVSRKMGFIPLPLGVVMLRVVYTSVKSTNPGAWAVVLMAYCCLLTFRILGSIVILGKACDLVDEHQGKQEEKKRPSTEVAPSPHLLTGGGGQVADAGTGAGSFDSIGQGARNANIAKMNSPPNQNFFQLPTEPAGHRKMSEVTDVITVRMNSKMKEVERLSEGEEEYIEENKAYFAGKVQASMVGDGEGDYLENGAKTEAVRRVGVLNQDFLGEDLVNGNILEAVSEGASSIDIGSAASQGDEHPLKQMVSPNISTRKSNGSLQSSDESIKDLGGSEASCPRERSSASLSTSLTSSTQNNAGIGEQEAEAILRYRSVQRSMSSPDLVLPEGLPSPDWGEERGQGEE